MKSTDYYGLNSPGLTCYLNCVLQVLFMTEDFCEAVIGFVTCNCLNLVNMRCQHDPCLHFISTDGSNTLLSRCNYKKASVLDQHLHQLFTDLRKSEAQTHNIIDTLGITNSQLESKCVAPLI